MKLVFHIILVSLIVSSCDPGHSGVVMIKNSSNDTLKLKYVTTHKSDTIESTLLPRAEYQYSFSGLGKAKNYDCCPCEYNYLMLKPVNTNKAVTKDLKNKENWQLDKSEIKTFKKGDLRCYFVINQSDITP